MLQRVEASRAVLGRGVYSASEAVRLLNFDRVDPGRQIVTGQTVRRWLQGYTYRAGNDTRYSAPLWQPDYANDDGQLELSFRDLIELRFVSAFRALGLGLPTIRACFQRAVEEVRDERPFSTRRFRTDGRTIFLDITSDLPDGELIDLKQRQRVFRTIVAPSLRDLEFDAEVVARWYPLGFVRPSIVIDPARAFGRPIAADTGVPTEVLAEAITIEGSVEKVASLYEVTPAAVRDAWLFEQKLAA